MRFHSTSLADACLIELTPFRDARGSFARTFCAREFGEAGLPTQWVQQNLSASGRKGSIRGMHFQRAPYTEDKLVRCVRGAIVDIIVDLRKGSPTFLRHESFELSEDDERQLYVPKGFAHGFQTLTEDARVTYLVSAFYEPSSEGGVRYDDPFLNIEWPLPVGDISDKDRNWPLIKADEPELSTAGLEQFPTG